MDSKEIGSILDALYIAEGKDALDEKAVMEKADYFADNLAHAIMILKLATQDLEMIKNKITYNPEKSTDALYRQMKFQMERWEHLKELEPLQRNIDELCRHFEK